MSPLRMRGEHLDMEYEHVKYFMEDTTLPEDKEDPDEDEDEDDDDDYLDDDDDEEEDDDEDSP